MNQVKKYGAFLISLLIALIILQFVLRTTKKVPVVGNVSAVAQDLAFNEN